MQKVLLSLSLIIVATAGLVTVPFMARNLPAEKMAAVSIIFLLNAFAGVFDVLRPVFIRIFCEELQGGERSIKILPAFKLSVAWALGLSSSFFVAGLFFFSSYFDTVSLLLLATGAFFYFTSISLWSVLDATSRVGLAQFVRSLFIGMVYFTFCTLSFYTSATQAFSLVYACGHLLTLVTYFYFAKYSISWSSQGVSTIPFSSIAGTMEVNVAKMVIDFSDRFVFAKILPVPLFASYGMIYEFCSKLNIVPQYINSYIYPKLCCAYAKDGDTAAFNSYLRITHVNFILFMLLTLLLVFTSNDLVALYLGEKYREYGYLLLYLTLVSSFYSLAFYGQSFMRASGNFAGLAGSFNLSALLGVLLGIISFSLWRVEGLFLTVLFLKSPGVGLYLSLVQKQISPVALYSGFVLVNLFTFMVLALAFKNPVLAAFGASGLSVISVASSFLIQKQQLTARQMWRTTQ